MGRRRGVGCGQVVVVCKAEAMLCVTLDASLLHGHKAPDAVCGVSTVRVLSLYTDPVTDPPPLFL
jgi:hypothetical protein